MDREINVSLWKAEMQGKNDDGVIFVGQRGIHDIVRCAKIKGVMFQPEYSDMINWEYSNNLSFIIVRDVHIPLYKFRDSTFQCWSTDFSTIILNEESFIEKLKELQ